MRQENSATFGAANVKAKLVAHLARLIRRHRLDYAQFEALCKAARKETGLRRPARSRRLPRCYSEAGGLNIMKRATTLAILVGMLVGIQVLVLRLGTVHKAQAQSPCTNANFRGAYGYTFTGTTGPDAVFLAASGRLVADGERNLYGAETVSFDGEISRRNYTGTYKVNSDCTGSATSNDNTGATTHCDFVIVAGGTEIQVIEADAQTVIVGCLRRQ